MNKKTEHLVVNKVRQSFLEFTSFTKYSSLLSSPRLLFFVIFLDDAIFVKNVKTCSFHHSPTPHAGVSNDKYKPIKNYQLFMTDSDRYITKNIFLLFKKFSLLLHSNLWKNVGII